MPAPRYFRGDKPIRPARLSLNIHPDIAAAAKKAAKKLDGGLSALVSQLLSEHTGKAAHQ